jgi:hypothetical protein
VTHIATNAQNVLHGHEHMRQRDVGTRFGRVQTPRYGKNLVCCILYALPELLSGVNSAGVNNIFRGTPQVEVYRIEVW